MRIVNYELKRGVIVVYRIFVEKKPGLDNEARGLKNDVVEFLGIKGL